MTPYFVAYGLSIVASVFRSKDNSKSLTRRNLPYCVIVALIWILLLGLRHPKMGIDLKFGDMYGYLGRFEYIASLRWRDLLSENVQHYERGYMLFNRLLGVLGDDYQILLFACALVCLVPVFVWICRNSEYPSLSLVIYLGLPCFLLNYSGLRQSLAIAITVSSIECIKDRKLIRFLILVALATTFHSSAWVFLAAYPIYHFKMGKAISILTVFLPAISYVFRYPLFYLLSGLFKENAKPDDNGAFMLFLVFWLVYFFAVVFGHERDREELGLRNLFLVACVCQGMGGVYSIVIRVGYYYMVALVLLLPKIIKNNRYTFSWRWNSSGTLIMYLGIYICFAVFGLYCISNTYWAEANPYMFFWQ